jgi:hypothetical protein
MEPDAYLVRGNTVSPSLTENRRVSMPYPREQVISRVDPGNLFDYTVVATDTWSNIAACFLKGRSDLWWCIAECSGVIDPFTELVEGRVLKVPTWDAVMFNILSFEDERPPGEVGGGHARPLVQQPWPARPVKR